MKNLLITFLLLASPTAIAQDSSNLVPGQDKKKQKWEIDITNLPPPQRQKLFEYAQKATQYFEQKRIFECLKSIYGAEEIYKNFPALLNLKGACYVEMRNFEKAREIFYKVAKLSPNDTNVIFNIGEMAFVTKDWKKSYEIFTDLLPRLKENQQSMSHLVRFKLALCHIKLDQYDAAEAIVNEYDFMSDSPIYFYGKSALEYAKGNKYDSERWLARANRVFEGAELSPWQDTLIEFGYIKSFYGGDLEGSEEALIPGLESNGE